MSDGRQELLCLLRDAYMCGQRAAQLLTLFLERHRDGGQVSAAIETFLAKTVEHQRLLTECLSRIEERAEVPQPDEMICSAGQRLENPPAENLLHELSNLRACILREIDLYSSVIATAEASGFFETRFVCERVRSDKSSMAAWLELRTSLNDQSGRA